MVDKTVEHITPSSGHLLHADLQLVHRGFHKCLITVDQLSHSAVFQARAHPDSRTHGSSDLWDKSGAIGQGLSSISTGSRSNPLTPPSRGSSVD
ncbi:MAG: hypothetical protein P8171_16045 [Candidatus Thiodiazotropha sp.]